MRLQQRGFAVLQPADVAAWAGCTLPDLQALQSDWNDLPPRPVPEDGGRYRRRRHASMTVQGGEVQQGAPPRPLAAGGIQRPARRHGALV